MVDRERQTLKDAYVWNLKKWYNKLIYKTNSATDIENKHD